LIVTQPYDQLKWIGRCLNSIGGEIPADGDYPWENRKTSLNLLMMRGFDMEAMAESRPGFWRPA
jgi:hypothetical protein